MTDVASFKAATFIHNCRLEKSEIQCIEFAIYDK